MNYYEERLGVTLTSHGKKIFGILHLPAHLPIGKTKSPCALFCTGFGGNKCGKFRLALRQAEALARAGIASFRFDYRGTGDSEGGFDEITIASQLQDIYCAQDFLMHHDAIDSKRMAIIGRSLGGALATMVAATTLPKTVVLWSPVFDAVPWFTKTMEHKALQFTDGGDTISFAGTPLHPTLISELQALDMTPHLVKLVNTPLLIVHGEKDATLGMYHFNKYRAARASSSDVTSYVLLPESGHDFHIPEEQEMLLQKTTDWLITYTSHDSKIDLSA